MKQVLDSKNITAKEQQHIKRKRKTATELRHMYAEEEFGKTTELPRYNSQIRKNHRHRNACFWLFGKPGSLQTFGLSSRMYFI